MHERYDRKTDAYLTTDGRGRVRQVSHRQRPVRVQARSARAAAREYLARHGGLLGIDGSQLPDDDRRPAETPDAAGVEYRFLESKSFFDLTTVGYQQTYLGLAVWGAGLGVHVKMPEGRSARVVGAASTAHEEISVERPSKRKLDQVRKLTPKALSRALAVEDDELEIVRTRLVVFRYRAGDRLPHHDEPTGVDRPQLAAGRPATDAGAFRERPLDISPPPVPDEIEDGSHRVAIEVIFARHTRSIGRVVWRTIVDVETLAVLYLRPFVDNVDGLVFTDDPITVSGNAANVPSVGDATLNPLRTSVTLQGLTAPAPGSDQELIGTYVEISDFEQATVAPPTESAGTDFDYDARTNDFAAVNAYHHCHAFFALVEDLGFPIATYFDGTSFPLPVDHRGRFLSADGIEVNASCSGDGLGGIANCDYELADTSDLGNPLGIATDRRVVLHELGGHGVLYDHVNAANFGFAHSAGDSFAAILADPTSLAPDRFLTFPWLITSRRHDRDVASGWAWGGTNDTGSYNSEQIVATTMFRIYRSLGGDSTSLAKRQWAARTTAYLLLQAIGTLTPATNPTDPGGLADALLAADAADWTSEGDAGGAYGKVIRWAFEKQGLYQPVGAPSPVTSEGDPPAIDVYVDDGRQGEYEYLGNHWSCQAIWNRLAADGGTGHEQPIVGVSNYAYVKIKNRGTQTATGVIVRGFHCQPGAGLTWPDDWQPMVAAQLAAPDVAPNDAAEITVGPFEWIPSQPDHECMLMIVSANGDASNIDNFDPGETIPEWRLVPHDNNIGQRNVSPVPGGGGGGGLLSAFPTRFLVRNPFDRLVSVELDASLPKLLGDRSWRVAFGSPGGAGFRLAPGQSREVVLQLEAGSEFSREDVGAAADRTLNVRVVADGIPIGGMSYELDPQLERAPSPYPEAGRGKECAPAARRLLDCLDLPAGEVRCVRLRKVVVEIDFAERDDCDGC